LEENQPLKFGENQPLKFGEKYPLKLKKKNLIFLKPVSEKPEKMGILKN